MCRNFMFTHWQQTVPVILCMINFKINVINVLNAKSPLPKPGKGFQQKNY